MISSWACLDLLRRRNSQHNRRSTRSPYVFCKTTWPFSVNVCAGVPAEYRQRRVHWLITWPRTGPPVLNPKSTVRACETYISSLNYTSNKHFYCLLIASQALSMQSSPSTTIERKVLPSGCLRMLFVIVNINKSYDMIIQCDTNSQLQPDTACNGLQMSHPLQCCTSAG
jgi:hypothetical protein